MRKADLVLKSWKEVIRADSESKLAVSALETEDDGPRSHNVLL